MVLSTRVQVPLPLLVAVWVWPLTMMRTVAVVSSTSPVRAGVVSFVTSVLTVMVGAWVSTVSSLDVASVPTLEAESVALTATLKVPSPSPGLMVLSARVQVPLPLLVAAWVWAPTVTEMVALVSSTLPVRAGRLSVVVRVFTVTTGAVVSTINSPELSSIPVLPAASVAVAVTS